MASQKLSPRQKMINIMYLVLTAMLALNVSMEVLNAFVRMEEGFQQSLQIVKSNNSKTYRDFQAADAKEHEKVGMWLEKATLVREATKKLSDFIDSTKLELVYAVDGANAPAVVNNQIIPHKISNIGNTDVGTRILIGENKVAQDGKGYILQKMIEDYREFLVSIVNETSESGTDSMLISTIRGLLKTDKNKEMETVGSEHDWAHSLFYNTTLISDIALLSKFQLDILSSESAMLGHLFAKITAGDYKFSNIKVMVKSNSDYILEGSQYEAEIFLAAYNDQMQTHATISGTQYSSESDGVIRYTSVGRSPGHVSIPAQIKFNDPKGGDDIVENFNIEYNVIKPMATVSPVEMNVLYIGLPNPLDISVGAGVPLDKVRARINGNDLQRNGSLFTYTPPVGMKNCEVVVEAQIDNAWKPMGTAKFRVREVPRPTPTIDGVSGKTATKSEMSSSQGIRAKMPADFNFNFNFTIKSFVVSVVGSDGFLNQETSSSGYFTDKQRRLFSNLRAGNQVTITDIQAIGPGGSVMELSDLVVRIK